jgi:hypothetical protein
MGLRPNFRTDSQQYSSCFEENQSMFHTDFVSVMYLFFVRSRMLSCYNFVLNLAQYKNYIIIGLWKTYQICSFRKISRASHDCALSWWCLLPEADLAVRYVHPSRWLDSLTIFFQNWFADFSSSGPSDSFLFWPALSMIKADRTKTSHWYQRAFTKLALSVKNQSWLRALFLSTILNDTGFHESQRYWFPQVSTIL